MTLSPNSAPRPRPWQEGDEEPVSFGTWLRRQREGREITLREIADNSKISLRYLEAFEEDRFDVLPATVFAKGFLREYGKYVGLNPDEVVNHYLSAIQTLEPDDDEPPATAAPAEKKSWTLGLLVALGFLLVVALVAFLSFQNERRRRAEETEASASPPPPAAAARMPLAEPPSTLEPTPVAEAEQPAAPIQVTLDFTDNCWVEISVDGRPYFEGVQVQGESRRVPAQQMVVLTVGNAGGVEVQVNGRPFDLQRGPGQVVRGVRIDLDTVRSLEEAS